MTRCLSFIPGLHVDREAVLDALSVLGAKNVHGGEGAIYLWAKLPEGMHLFCSWALSAAVRSASCTSYGLPYRL